MSEAVAAGDVKAVKRFLRKGADPNQEAEGDFDSVLHIAAGKGPGAIVKLLIDHGADIEAATGPYGLTALLVAVENGNLEAAQGLLEHGANLKAYVEPQGDSIDTPTALDIASRKKNDNMRQLLLRFGAEYSELMDPKDFQRGGDE